MSLYLLTFTGR